MSQARHQRHYALVEKALRYLQDHQQQQPELGELAAHCAMSETHFQRLFSQWAGVSPKRFLQCLTRQNCRQRLLEGWSLADCSDAAGLSSSSRLHDLMVKLEAVTPGEIKRGGDALQFHWGVHPTHFGYCFIACTERGIHQLDFLDGDDPGPHLESLHQRWPRAQIVKHAALTAAHMAPLQDVEQRQAGQPLTLCLRGTAFQFKVWEALLRIPEGQLCTYGGLARAIGQPGAARAVGSAVASNPIAWLIPCHRVIRQMGVIGDYRWGAIRKQALLGWEANQAGTQGEATPALQELTQG